MGRTNKQVNGGMADQMTAALNTPIIPVKTEAELLLEAELEKLKAQNEALRNQAKAGLTLKISEKGALSVYGMGRFPFTLYVEQWERLFAMAEEIKAFMKANSSRLSRKQ